MSERLMVLSCQLGLNCHKSLGMNIDASFLNYPLLLVTQDLAHVLLPNVWLHFIKSFQRLCLYSGLYNGMKNMFLIQDFKDCMFKRKRSWLQMPNIVSQNSQFISELYFQKYSATVLLRAVPFFGPSLFLQLKQELLFFFFSNFFMNFIYAEVPNTLGVSACRSVKYSSSGRPKT